MKKFSKLNDIAFHLVNKVNKKKLKINTLILKNWEYIFGQNNKFVQLKKTIINNKIESVIKEKKEWAAMDQFTMTYISCENPELFHIEKSKETDFSPDRWFFAIPYFL